MVKSVVVIGSGPTDPELRGDYIDSHAAVVRMWNHEWQPAARYGSRYDFGLITTAKDAHLTSRCPVNSWFFYNVPHEPAVAQINGRPVVALDHMGWFSRVKAQGYRLTIARALKFTRGFAAVAGVIEHLRPRRIIAVGMDVLCNGATGQRYFAPEAHPYYLKSYPELAKDQPCFANDEVPAGLTCVGPHDYAAESVLIRTLAREAGTELVWEQANWKNENLV